MADIVVLASSQMVRLICCCGAIWSMSGAAASAPNLDLDLDLDRDRDLDLDRELARFYYPDMTTNETLTLRHV